MSVPYSRKEGTREAAELQTSNTQRTNQEAAAWEAAFASQQLPSTSSLAGHSRAREPGGDR